MRIALAQINSRLADFAFNRSKILEFTHQASGRKCDLVIFPEASLFGYPSLDLLERPALVKEQISELKKLHKEMPKGVAALVGFYEPNNSKRGRPYYNSAALLEKGKPIKVFRKELLAVGDVFDEGRFLESGDVKKNIFKYKNKKFLLTICEDIWAWGDKNGRSLHKENPLVKLKGERPDFVINMSASPFYLGKETVRKYFTSETSRNFKCPLIYVNAVGAQDEIIFDGGSFVIDAKGKTKLNCLSFEEDINVIDTETLEAWNRVASLSKIEELHRALVLGIKDFCSKTGMTHVHLGSSGGIDSAVVAALATDALGPNCVTQIAMPGPHSSPVSEKLAEDLARNLGNNFIKVPIQEMFQVVDQSLKVPFEFSNFGLTQENIQARLRGLVLMAYSNKTNSMLLNTSNKSEFASGYSTLYGDMCGGLSPLGDLTKEQVYDLARYYNQEGEVIPSEIITRPPSAELRPDQKDSDSLPSYELLDAAVIKIVEKCKDAKSDVETWLLQAIMKSEFKRWQAAPILKVSSHAFGRGRRYPIAHRAKK